MEGCICLYVPEYLRKTPSGNSKPIDWTHRDIEVTTVLKVNVYTKPRGWVKIFTGKENLCKIDNLVRFYYDSDSSIKINFKMKAKKAFCIAVIGLLMIAQEVETTPEAIEKEYNALSEDKKDALCPFTEEYLATVDVQALAKELDDDADAILHKDNVTKEQAIAFQDVCFDIFESFV